MSKPALAVGGLAVAAVLLIVVLGSGGGSETATVEVPAEQCLASQASPIEFPPAGGEPQELSRDELADKTGFDVSGLPETASFYELGSETDSSFAILMPADEESFHATAQGAFETTVTGAGFRPATPSQGGAIKYVSSDQGVALYGRNGCYSVVVLGESEVAAEQSANALLAPVVTG